MHTDCFASHAMSVVMHAMVEPRRLNMSEVYIHTPPVGSAQAVGHVFSKALLSSPSSVLHFLAHLQPPSYYTEHQPDLLLAAQQEPWSWSHAVSLSIATRKSCCCSGYPTLDCTQGPCTVLLAIDSIVSLSCLLLFLQHMGLFLLNLRLLLVVAAQRC